MSPIEKPDPPASIDYHRNLQNHRNHKENEEDHQQQHFITNRHQHHRKQRQQYDYQFKLHNKRRGGHKSVIDHHLTAAFDNNNTTSLYQNNVTKSAAIFAGSSEKLNNHRINSSFDNYEDEDDGEEEESDDNNNNHQSFRICESFQDTIEQNTKNNDQLSSIDNDEEYLKDHLYETIDDDLPNKCECNRQLFGIQLEVTSLLLEAERRKLAVLQRELQVALEDGGSIKKAKEQFKQELILAISRIQLQYDILEKEYEQHAIGRLRSSNTRGIGKSNRSQPAIGLKQTPKSRVSPYYKYQKYF